MKLAVFFYQIYSKNLLILLEFTVATFAKLNLRFCAKYRNEMKTKQI